MDNLSCCHPASVNVDVANIYYSLAKMLRPMLIVEIGCFIGFSTQHFAQAITELGFGKIISIDAFDWDVDAGRGLQNRQEVAEYYRQQADIAEIVTFVKGYSDQIYSQVAAQIKHKIDLLYIDGDHTAPGVFKDFNLYYPDVRVGGNIILHDIFPEMCGVDGPRILLDTLKNSKFYPKHIEILEMPTKDGFGIAVLRKLSAVPIALNLAPYLSPAYILQRLNLRFLWTKINKLWAAKTKKQQVYQVSFQVLDADSGKPLEGVHYTCPQRFPEERFTDAEGKIYMPHYLPNRYIINFTKQGYQALTQQLVDIPYAQAQHHFVFAMQAL